MPVAPTTSATIFMGSSSCRWPALATRAPAAAVRVSESVAELLPGFGSVTPAGAVTVAVLLNVPVAAAEIVQLAV